MFRPSSGGYEVQPMELEEEEVVLIKTETPPVKAEPMRVTRSRSAALLRANGSSLWPTELASIKTEIKSESVWRAEAAEARVVALEAALAEQSTCKKRCSDWDTESDSLLLKKRLVEKDK